MLSITKEQLATIHTKILAGTATPLEIDIFAKVRKKATQANFPYYCKRMYEGEIEWLWFQIYLQERLQKIIEEGKGWLVVETPPQHAKTTIASSLLVSYILGRFPDKRCILSTYNAERAKKNCEFIIKEMGKDTYKSTFNTRIKSTYTDEIDDYFNQDLRQDCFGFNVSNHPKGNFFATSIGGILTGESGDILILDDYHKDKKEARSLVERQNIFEWFQTCFRTRKQINSIMIIFATRWHDDDLIGRLTKLQKINPELFDFERITFPAIRDVGDFEERPYDPRELNMPLWDHPEKIKDYKQQKELGYEDYMALFQQRPVTEIGVVFQREWFQVYYAPPERYDRIIISVDTSYRAKSADSDDCAITVHGQLGRNWFLIEFVARRMGYVETKELIRALRKKYRCHYIIIESRSNGGPLIEELEMEFPGIIGFDPAGLSKRERAELVTTVFANSNYHIPSKELCPNIEYYLTQFLQFTGEPGGKDDCVDTVTQMLLKLGDLEYRITNESCYSIKTLSSRIGINGRPGSQKQSYKRGPQRNIASNFIQGRSKFFGRNGI